MPEPAVVGAFIAASVLLVALPGPNLLYIVTRSVSQGRRAGVVSALGVETGTVVHVVAAVLGLSTLVAASPAAMTVLKLAGVAYLIYLGIGVLRDRSAEGTPVAAEPLGRIYLDGVLVNLLNPKVVLFFLAFLPQFVGEVDGSARTRILVLGAIFVVLAMTMDLGYAIAGARLREVLLTRPRFRTAQRVLAVTVYFGLAGYTLLG
ncbi:MAG: LysE family translocator [Pseudonocardiaceae bacterium]|nr:LysE family translocator [Pseudonocardiaceae bacterium]